MPLFSWYQKLKKPGASCAICKKDSVGYEGVYSLAESMNYRNINRIRSCVKTLVPSITTQ